jgi:hypothetical protein
MPIVLCSGVATLNDSAVRGRTIGNAKFLGKRVDRLDYR